MDPQARGVIFGLDLSHTRAHIFRATLEAVMYGFRHHVDVLDSAGLTPARYLGDQRRRQQLALAADCRRCAERSDHLIS